MSADVSDLLEWADGCWPYWQTRLGPDGEVLEYLNERGVLEVLVTGEYGMVVVE